MDQGGAANSLFHDRTEPVLDAYWSERLDQLAGIARCDRAM